MVGAVFFHRLRDVLKADEQFAEATGSVKCGHCFCQRRRHQSFHHIILRRKPSGRFSFAEQIIGDQSSDLITTERCESARSIANHNPQTIRVRIGSDDQVRWIIRRLHPINHRIKDFQVFRIRSMLGHVREISVRRSLWLKNIHCRIPGRQNNGIHIRLTNPMQRSKDGSDGTVAGLRQLRNSPDIFSINVRTNNRDATVGHCRRKVHCRNLLCSFNLADDSLVVRRDDLPAVAPISLETVISRGIMRCRNHDADIATQMSHRKRQSRCGSIAVEQKHLQSMRGESAGGDSGEVGRVIASVMSNHGGAAGCTPGGSQIDGHPMSRFGDRPIINRGRSHFSHWTAPSTSAERNCGPEHFIQLRPFAGTD